MPDGDELSFFARKFKIPNIKSDRLRWNKEWEKVLRTHSSKDVYTILCTIWKRDDLAQGEFSHLPQTLNDGLCKSQEVLVHIWDEMLEGGHLPPAWILLGEEERKRHLLNGLEEACQVSCGQDLRALCPEITLSLMLKQNGKGFIDFIGDYTEGIKNVGAGNPYSLPSEWWQKAVDIPEPWPEEDVRAFALLTLQRNEFLTRFLMCAAMSILHDLSYGSPGMDKVTDIMKTGGGFAMGMADTLASMRDKPLIRCENCTKSPDEIGENVKFMLCSNCKTKLDFTVHYCSQDCQKKDWRNHKKHCGKEKVSKKLQGTAQDPLWAFPNLPDHLRSSMPTQDGDVSITSLGFGTPHPDNPHSPALQRQVSLITRDKEAEYFLFDQLERPFRFVLRNPWMKMSFRILRSDAIFGPDRHGLEAIAEYLIKVMGDKPGFSRERILAQLSSEYGGDVTAKVEKFESMAVVNGYEPGTVFLEVMSKNLSSVPGMNRWQT